MQKLFNFNKLKQILKRLKFIFFDFFWFFFRWQIKFCFSKFIFLYSMKVQSATKEQRDVSCFLFCLLTCIFVCFCLHLFIIKLKNILVLFFLFFFIFYIGGGLLAGFLYKKNMTKKENKNFIFKLYLIIYEDLFCSEYGKIYIFFSKKILWYVQNIHPLWTNFFKFKVTGFRFFCYSIGSWINIIIFLNVVPSFISEGLGDPSYLFTGFFCITQKQRKDLLKMFYLNSIFIFLCFYLLLLIYIIKISFFYIVDGILLLFPRALVSTEKSSKSFVRKILQGLFIVIVNFLLNYQLLCLFLKQRLPLFCGKTSLSLTWYFFILFLFLLVFGALCFIFITTFKKANANQKLELLRHLKKNVCKCFFFQLLVSLFFYFVYKILPQYEVVFLTDNLFIKIFLCLIVGFLFCCFTVYLIAQFKQEKNNFNFSFKTIFKIYFISLFIICYGFILYFLVFNPSILNFLDIMTLGKQPLKPEIIMSKNNSFALLHENYGFFIFGFFCFMQGSSRAFLNSTFFGYTNLYERAEHVNVMTYNDKSNVTLLKLFPTLSYKQKNASALCSSTDFCEKAYIQQYQNIFYKGLFAQKRNMECTKISYTRDVVEEIRKAWVKHQFLVEQSLNWQHKKVYDFSTYIRRVIPYKNNTINNLGVYINLAANIQEDNKVYRACIAEYFLNPNTITLNNMVTSGLKYHSSCESMLEFGNNVLYKDPFFYSGFQKHQENYFTFLQTTKNARDPEIFLNRVSSITSTIEENVKKVNRSIENYYFTLYKSKKITLSEYIFSLEKCLITEKRKPSEVLDVLLQKKNLPANDMQKSELREFLEEFLK